MTCERSKRNACRNKRTRKGINFVVSFRWGCLNGMWVGIFGIMCQEDWHMNKHFLKKWWNSNTLLALRYQFTRSSSYTLHLLLCDLAWGSSILTHLYLRYFFLVLFLLRHSFLACLSRHWLKLKLGRKFKIIREHFLLIQRQILQGSTWAHFSPPSKCWNKRNKEKSGSLTKRQSFNEIIKHKNVLFHWTTEENFVI